MDILTTLAVTLMTLGTVYLLMLVVFNAVVIYFIVKYWPYVSLLMGLKVFKKHMDKELEKEKNECDCSRCIDKDK